MQKYRTTEYLDLLVDGEAYPVADRFNHEQPVYLASEVDAWIKKMMVDTEESNLQALHDHIAELEKALREMPCECYRAQGLGKDQCPRCAALGL